MPDFAASPLVDALEENLFSLLENLAAEVNTDMLPLIDLSSGSPDQPTPPEVIDALQSAIHRRENHGYPSFWGKPQVREAIAHFIAASMMWNSIRTAKSRYFRARISVLAASRGRCSVPGNTSSPPIPAIPFIAQRRCSPRRRFMACRSGLRTISCRILTTSPGGG